MHALNYALLTFLSLFFIMLLRTCTNYSKIILKKNGQRETTDRLIVCSLLRMRVLGGVSSSVATKTTDNMLVLLLRFTGLLLTFDKLECESFTVAPVPSLKKCGYGYEKVFVSGVATRSAFCPHSSILVLSSKDPSSPSSPSFGIHDNNKKDDADVAAQSSTTSAQSKGATATFETITIPKTRTAASALSSESEGSSATATARSSKPPNSTSSPSATTENVGGEKKIYLTNVNDKKERNLFETLQNRTVHEDPHKVLPLAPPLSYDKFLTMQDKRVVVTIRYSGESGLRPFFLTAAKKLKLSVRIAQIVQRGTH